DPFRTRSLSLPAPMVLLLWWGWESRSLPRFFLGVGVSSGAPALFFCALLCEHVNCRLSGSVRRSGENGDRYGPGDIEEIDDDPRDGARRTIEKARGIAVGPDQRIDVGDHVAGDE